MHEREDGRALLDDIDWVLVAQKVGTRTRTQCMDKWYNSLAPSMVSQGMSNPPSPFNLDPRAPFSQASFCRAKGGLEASLVLYCPEWLRYLLHNQNTMTSQHEKSDFRAPDVRIALGASLYCAEHSKIS